MLTQDQVWQAIDEFASRHNLSTSGLAKLAGLDPTAFNKSKRTASDGRLRWPSTESIAKILDATGSTMEEFAEAFGSRTQKLMTIPLLGFGKAGEGGYFDDSGFPVGSGWDEIEIPGQVPGSYALEVKGDSMVPLYRDGDVVVVQPGEALRRDDKVAARTKEGEVLIKVLSRQTVKTVELTSVNPVYPPRVIPRINLEWIARITWARQ
jgi:phage repressor protein C with HTH and peptisase S24 domain